MKYFAKYFRPKISLNLTKKPTRKLPVSNTSWKWRSAALCHTHAAINRILPYRGALIERDDRWWPVSTAMPTGPAAHARHTFVARDRAASNRNTDNVVSCSFIQALSLQRGAATPTAVIRSFSDADVWRRGPQLGELTAVCRFYSYSFGGYCFTRNWLKPGPTDGR